MAIGYVFSLRHRADTLCLCARQPPGWRTFPIRFTRSTGWPTPAGTLKPLRNEEACLFFVCIRARGIAAIREQQLGELTTLDIPRGSAISFRLEKDLTFDPAFLRHKKFLEDTSAGIPPGYCPRHRAERAGHSGRVAGEESEGSAGGLVAYQSPRICCAAFRVVAAHASAQQTTGRGKENRRCRAAGLCPVLPDGGGSLCAQYRFVPPAGTVHRPPLRPDASRCRYHLPSRRNIAIAAGQGKHLCLGFAAGCRLRRMYFCWRAFGRN